jgi:hypothetical protein
MDREEIHTDELIRRREKQDDYRDRGVVDPIAAGKDDYWEAMRKEAKRMSRAEEWEEMQEAQARAEYERACELSDALMPLLYSYQEEHGISDSAMARALRSLAHAWNSCANWGKER